jgi:hypothetical protein
MSVEEKQAYLEYLKGLAGNGRTRTAGGGTMEDAPGSQMGGGTMEDVPGSQMGGETMELSAGSPKPSASVLGQISPDEKAAYAGYLRSIAAQKSADQTGLEQSQDRMGEARGQDVMLSTGNQVGAVMQNMLGQQGNAQMFARNAAQSPMTAAAGQDNEMFARYLQDQAKRNAAIGEANIHMGARQTDLTQKAESAAQERQQALMRLISEQQNKKEAAREQREFLAGEHALDRASRRENAQIMAALAGGRRDDAAGAKASLVPDGWEFKDPRALKVVTEGYLTKIQDAAKAVGDVDALAGELEKIATDAGGREALGENRKISDSKYQGLVLRLKELENLGVLQKLDVDALKKLVRNPLERSTEPNSTYGNDLAQLKEFRKELAGSFDRTMTGKGLKRASSETPSGDAAEEETVDMLNPNGIRLPVFKSKVEAAKKAKWKVING